MCTPQLVQQAVASGQAAGIIPGQQPNPQQLNPQQAMAGKISELFDPRTGQRISQVGPAVEMPMVPISREEFDEEGPVHMMHSQINSIPRAPMPRMPMPAMQPIQRQPTVGELLGIPPGSVQEVGGPGRF